MLVQRCQPRLAYLNLALKSVSVATAATVASLDAPCRPCPGTPLRRRRTGPTTTNDTLGKRFYGYSTSENNESFDDDVCRALVRGIDFVRDPRLNKGMAFTLEERMALGIHGLIPPAFKTQSEQVKLCKANMDMYNENLQKYIYLTALQDRNERLFYSLLAENVEEMIPLIYTPTVGLACEKFGLIYRKPRGLFITIHDRGHVHEILKNWPESNIRAIVVTDGERILGLGDLGAYGMGIPVGKMALYTGLAGIKPSQCLPILLDVGTNRQRLLDDPFYIGLKHKRIQGSDYDDLLDEFMEAVVHRYGQNTLIQFEDFAIHNAFRLLEKYRNRYCIFNDDIQGTASVALAGVLTSLRITETQLTDQRILFMGAGGAALGIASLLMKAFEKEEGTEEKALAKIFLCDVNGLLVKGRTDLSKQQQPFSEKDMPQLKDFAEMIDLIKPTIIIGASAQPGTFTETVIKKMAEYNKRPVIFALSNPTSKAECTAADAYEHSEGRALFVSGSPFPEHNHKGKVFKPGQGNNAYIFPGVALGVIAAGIHHISDDLFLLAARELALCVEEADLEVGRLYPRLANIRSISLRIAKKICEEAYIYGGASTYPEPTDKEAFIKADLFDFNYPKTLPSVYPWPAETE